MSLCFDHNQMCETSTAQHDVFSLRFRCNPQIDHTRLPMLSRSREEAAIFSQHSRRTDQEPPQLPSETGAPSLEQGIADVPADRGAYTGV